MTIANPLKRHFPRMGRGPVCRGFLRRLVGGSGGTGVGGFARRHGEGGGGRPGVGAGPAGGRLLHHRRRHRRLRPAQTETPCRSPQQTTIGSGLIAILIGVSLIAAPAVINALGDTLGLSGGSHTVIKPRL